MDDFVFELVDDLLSEEEEGPLNPIVGSMPSNSNSSEELSLSIMASLEVIVDDGGGSGVVGVGGCV